MLIPCNPPCLRCATVEKRKVPREPYGGRAHVADKGATVADNSRVRRSSCACLPSRAVPVRSVRSSGQLCFIFSKGEGKGNLLSRGQQPQRLPRRSNEQRGGEAPAHTCAHSKQDWRLSALVGVVRENHRVRNGATHESSVLTRMHTHEPLSRLPRCD
jgi:hypothetical protein